MPLKTSVVGSWPKPSNLGMPDWFRLNQDCPLVTSNVSDFFKSSDPSDLKSDIYKATKECIEKQIDLGVDVITDGEINRENYIYHLCRHLSGFDFADLTQISMRNSATSYSACTVRHALSISDASVEGMVAHWRQAQQVAADYHWQEHGRGSAAEVTPVKVTIPGPMTIMNSTADAYYHNTGSECRDLVACINKLVRAYAAAGCRHIQIDEPLMVRQPELALKYGIDNVQRCFKGVGPEQGVTRSVHLCCGYPNYLDQEGYQKADKDVYWQLAPALDRATSIDAVSLEDAHRRNDPHLFSLFTRCTVELGVVRIASSRVEAVEEITAHLRSVLQYIPAERLVAVPDCGLGYLSPQLIEDKLANMVAAAARATTPA